MSPPVRERALELAIASHGPVPGADSDACFVARARVFETYLLGFSPPASEQRLATKPVVQHIPACEIEPGDDLRGYPVEWVTKWVDRVCVFDAEGSRNYGASEIVEVRR